jgi:hypothetical protein
MATESRDALPDQGGWDIHADLRRATFDVWAVKNDVPLVVQCEVLHTAIEGLAENLRLANEALGRIARHPRGGEQRNIARTTLHKLSGASDDLNQTPEEGTDA